MYLFVQKRTSDSFSVALENETWTCVKMNWQQPAIKLITGNTQIPPLNAIQYLSFDYSSCTVAQNFDKV